MHYYLVQMLPIVSILCACKWWKSVVGRLFTANKTADFEDEDAQEEDMFHREIFVRFPPYRLCGCQGEEHGRAIPAHILEAVELIGDGRDCCGDDGLAGFRQMIIKDWI